MTTDTPPLTDPETLRDRDDVPFHEQTDEVDAGTVDTVAELDDMAPVGVTDGDGQVLVARITDTCRWKIPSAAVADDVAFAAAAREWVHQNTGLALDLGDPEAVWQLRVTDGDRSASRYFVVYGAAVDGSPEIPTADAPDPAAETRWVRSLPEGGSEVPGTGLFVQ